MTQSSRAYFLVPVVYIGVILGLLFLQFSGGERLSRSVGPLTLHATRGAASDDGVPELRQVGLVFNGLSFRFVDEAGLIVETDDNVADMRVTRYDVREDGFDLLFEGEYRLSFVVTGETAGELRVRLDLPEDPTGVREISIPFDLNGVPVDSNEMVGSFVTVAVEEREYYFTAPPNATIDLANEKIVLRPDAAGQAIRFVQAREGDPARVVGWFEDDSLEIDDSSYTDLVAGYLDAAYRGWSNGRYNPADLTWDGAGGFASFSEEALTAYLAEAWARGDYDRAFAEMRRARDLHPDDLTLLSAPFLGNLTEIRERYLERDAVRADLIQEQINGGDLTVFRQQGLFLFAADRGSEELYGSLLELASAVDLRRFDVETAIGLLANLYLHELPDERAEALSLRAVDLIQLTILGSIVRTDAGFFVQTSPGQIDVYQTALAGAALNRYGASRSDALITTIGRNLVRSALSQADPNGVAPATLLVRGEALEAADGRLVPERLYPYLVRRTSYPHEVSLYEELGSGHWIWTSVGVSPIRLTDAEWRFEVTYPRLRTHYLLFQGVPTFEQMELFGQTWRDAPDFEIYSKGRHYDPASDTLMIKYYDDSVRREIVMLF